MCDNDHDSVSSALSSMVSATVRLVGAPDRTTGDDLGLMLPMIVTVVGITVLAACVIMIMIACLVRYRGKAKSTKSVRLRTYYICMHGIKHILDSYSVFSSQRSSVCITSLSCVLLYHFCWSISAAAEINAKRKQKELEEAASCSEPSSSPLSLMAPPIVADPLYDEVATRQVFAIQQCPAYAPLPPPRV